ncbi:MAG: alpha/beta hydrolase [Verrucomicrobiota bacterium]
MAGQILTLPVRLFTSGGAALIYYPRSYQDTPAYAASMRTVERLTYLSDGQPQTVFLDAPPDQPTERVWLFFGGNGSLALDWLPVTSFAPPSRDAFVFVDYPGYGNSNGEPSPTTIRNSVDALLKTLQERFKCTKNHQTNLLATMGHSLGAAVAMDTAARHRIREVVLLAPFTSMRAMAVRVAGRMMARCLRHHYDNLEALEKWSQAFPEGSRVRLFHGTHDEMIPLAMSRELHEQFPDHTDLETVPQGDHNGLVLQLKERLIGIITSPEP